MTEKDLNKEDLNKVTAGTGVEPEEFEFKTKGYTTPIKPVDPNETHFESIQDKK